MNSFSFTFLPISQFFHIISSPDFFPENPQGIRWEFTGNSPWVPMWIYGEKRETSVKQVWNHWEKWRNQGNYRENMGNGFSLYSNWGIHGKLPVKWKNGKLFSKKSVRLQRLCTVGSIYPGRRDAWRERSIISKQVNHLNNDIMGKRSKKEKTDLKQKLLIQLYEHKLG